MKIVRIGFKAFDPHELLCHSLAGASGAYERAGLRVELLDTTFIPNEKLPPDLFQVSCGAALLARLQGEPLRVVFAAAVRPMFWLYARGDASGIGDLRGRRIAVFPPVAPPWHFARILCRRAGVDPDRDLTLVPARDDAARLGLLQTGDVGASVISSALPPHEMQRRGFRPIVFFGDQLTVPTTGLAVNAALPEREPELVVAMIDAFRQGLEALHGDVGTVGRLLETHFNVPAAARESTAMLFRTCFSRDGRVSAEDAQTAIELMCEALGVAEVPDWRQIYDFSLLAR